MRRAKLGLPMPLNILRIWVYSFSLGSDGGYPYGVVIFDQSGNLYGPTYRGSTGNGPSIWELSPVNGGWNFAVLHSFNGNQGNPL
jgi:hypothetical protein